MYEIESGIEVPHFIKCKKARCFNEVAVEGELCLACREKKNAIALASYFKHKDDAGKKEQASANARRHYEKHYEEIKTKRKNNKQQINEYNKQYWINNKEIQNAKNKEWADNNKEIISENKKRYAKLNKEDIYIKTKLRRETYPERYRKHHLNRKARQRNAFVAEVNRIEIFERDSWICQICGDVVNSNFKHPDPFSASLDHIIPYAKGGTHEPSNTQLTHLRCNLSKGAKLL